MFTYGLISKPIIMVKFSLGYAPLAKRYKDICNCDIKMALATITIARPPPGIVITGDQLSKLALTADRVCLPQMR